MTTRSIRQSFLGESSDAVFGRAVVVIVGVCGGGSHIAQQLAHVGFRRFRIFDPDYVDYPNLNRMVGSKPSDAKAKHLKAEVIRQLILQIQPGAEIQVFAAQWQLHHLAIREASLVFGCVDSFGQRDQLEAYCRRFLLPYIDVGMDVHKVKDDDYTITGQVITSLPGEPCMRCTGFITERRIAQEAERYGDAGNRPQVVWPNGVLASTAVGIGVSLLTPWSAFPICRFIEYDGNRHELRASNVLTAISRSCPHYRAEDVGDTLWNPVGVEIKT
jgi:molybdopterin-synthase adenylyltransferase